MIYTKSFVNVYAVQKIYKMSVTSKMQMFTKIISLFLILFTGLFTH